MLYGVVNVVYIYISIYVPSALCRCTSPILNIFLTYILIYNFRITRYQFAVALIYLDIYITMTTLYDLPSINISFSLFSYVPLWFVSLQIYMSILAKINSHIFRPDLGRWIWISLWNLIENFHSHFIYFWFN